MYRAASSASRRTTSPSTAAGSSTSSIASAASTSSSAHEPANLRQEKSQPAVPSRGTRRRLHLRLRAGAEGRRGQHVLRHDRGRDALVHRGGAPRAEGGGRGSRGRGEGDGLSRGRARLRPLQRRLRQDVSECRARPDYGGGARGDQYENRNRRNRLQATEMSGAQMKLLGRKTSGNV